MYKNQTTQVVILSDIKTIFISPLILKALTLIILYSGVQNPQTRVKQGNRERESA